MKKRLIGLVSVAILIITFLVTVPTSHTVCSEAAPAPSGAQCNYVITATPDWSER